MSTPASRLITLIMLLQRKPNQKARELAENLGISVRTLHRYFEMLDEMGIPIYSERGPNGGFSLVRGYKMPPLVFTPEEATAVYLGTSLFREMWGTLYSLAAEGAMVKLENVLPNEQREEIGWARRALVASGLHRAELGSLAPLLEKIRLAMRRQRQVHIRYQGTIRQETTERNVNPYALAYRSGWWYMAGFCQLRQALRFFRVDRILELEALEQSFELPEELDIRGAMDAAFGEQPAIQARFRFASEAAHLAASNLITWKMMERNPDGSVEVVINGTDLNWLASMALSFGPWVKVLDPPELGALVRALAMETAAQYDGDRKIEETIRVEI